MTTAKHLGKGPPATPRQRMPPAFARAAFLISLDHRAPEDDRIGRIREVLTREPDTV